MKYQNRQQKKPGLAKIAYSFITVKKLLAVIHACNEAGLSGKLVGRLKSEPGFHARITDYVCTKLMLHFQVLILQKLLRNHPLSQLFQHTGNADIAVKLIDVFIDKPDPEQ